MKLREIDVFTANCLRFLESLTSAFVEMSPLKYAVVRNAESLNPEIMCITPEKSAKKKKRENRLDEFFSDIVGLSDHPKLSKVIKMIVALFLGE